MQKRKVLIFDKGSAMKSNHRQVLVRNFYYWLGTSVAGASKLLLLRTITMERFFRVAFLLLLYDLNHFIPTLYGQSYILIKDTTNFSRNENFPFSVILVQEMRYCFFSDSFALRTASLAVIGQGFFFQR